MAQRHAAPQHCPKGSAEVHCTTCTTWSLDRIPLSLGYRDSTYLDSPRDQSRGVQVVQHPPDPVVCVPVHLHPYLSAGWCRAPLGWCSVTVHL